MDMRILYSKLSKTKMCINLIVDVIDALLGQLGRPSNEPVEATCGCRSGPAAYQFGEQSTLHWADVVLGRSFPKANTKARRLLPSGTRTPPFPMGGCFLQHNRGHLTAAQT